MIGSKRIAIVVIVCLLTASCASNGGIKPCSGTALALSVVAGAGAGSLFGKTKKDKLKYAAGGAAIGAALVGIACLFNKDDRANTETILNEGIQVGGWCLHDKAIKTRGFKVKPKQCPNAVTPVNIKVVKTKKKNGTRCKTYQTEVIIDGELKTEKETACKGKNGNWSAINT